MIENMYGGIVGVCDIDVSELIDGDAFRHSEITRRISLFADFEEKFSLRIEYLHTEIHGISNIDFLGFVDKDICRIIKLANTFSPRLQPPLVKRAVARQRY